MCQKNVFYLFTAVFLSGWLLDTCVFLFLTFVTKDDWIDDGKKSLCCVVGSRVLMHVLKRDLLCKT